MASTGVMIKTAVAANQMTKTRGQVAFWPMSRNGVEGGGVNDAIGFMTDRKVRLGNALADKHTTARLIFG